jgi:hypothetical protein
VEVRSMWTKELPTELGFYWFFGYRSQGEKHRLGAWDPKTKSFGEIQKEPQLFIVRATRRESTGKPVLVIEGQFFDHQGAEGLWLPCETPELPKVSALEMPRDFDKSKENPEA